MARYTTRTLSDDIHKINGWLKDGGFTTRLVQGGRNGYQAVDEYSVDEDGNRIGSGVNRNVCCGSSRECYADSYAYYNSCVRRRDQEELLELRERVNNDG